MSLPDFFASEEQYEEWLDKHVQEQTDELLEYMLEKEIDKETIDEWCRDAPFTSHDTMDLAHVYHDVKAHSTRASHDHGRKRFNNVEWFNSPYQCMAQLVTEWIAMDVADRMQIEVESRGVPTGPPVEEIET